MEAFKHSFKSKQLIILRNQVKGYEIWQLSWQLAIGNWQLAVGKTL